MGMQIPFHKFHGAGNDFILLDGRLHQIASIPPEGIVDLAKAICHRRFGIGADGLMVARMDRNGRIHMQYLNSDGSAANMCGNGIRCFARYVFEKGFVRSPMSANTMTFEVITGCGPLSVTLQFDKREVSGVRVAMGCPDHEAPGIGCGEHHFILDDECRGSAAGVFDATTVLLGVPHTIILVDDIQKVDVESFGRRIETMAVFPHRTNVNFVQVMDRGHLQVHTWERGAGFTLACGTGVCASVAVARRKCLCDDKVRVTVPGGELTIEIGENGEVFMTGGASQIASGQYNMEE